MRHRTVLIIDDSQRDRSLLRQYLLAEEEISYTLRESNSAASALAICRQELPDGILLEIKLSDADGFEFLTQLKAQTSGNCPPVIVVSCANDAVTAAKAFKNGVEDYLVKGQTTPDEVRLAMRGAIENVELRGKLQRGFVSTWRDVTERKIVEVALRQSQERYRILAEAIPQFVFITSADGKNEFVNQQFCNYTGLSVEQLLHLDWLTIIHPDDVERTRERWMMSVNTGCLYEIEYRFRHADGTYRWFLGQGVPMKDEYGHVLKWIGTCTDIDQQKQLETERIRLLEKEQAAREAAEKANQIKDEFLAVLSHELRSPLNPILGWSKLLQTGNLDATKTANALATIERNAKLQSQLIEDLLDVSRILQGKLSLNVTSVDLVTTIASAIETVRLAAETKNIQIKVLLAPNVGQISGDASRLQQIVWNLLSNAVKFTPKGGIVEVRLTQVEDHAQIQVIDTGKGILPDFLPYVFEHFRQEDGATTRKFGGLGLGLAIVRQLVELHGGTVEAESPGEGQGATFTVRIPITSASLEMIPNGTSPQSLDLSGLQILVVDDDPDSRDFVAFVLEEAGASVLSLSSGTEALKVLSLVLPDILVSDIGMPEMDGYMLIREIRSRVESEGIPAIALTAYAGEFDQKQALAAGFQRHLSKPVDPDTLVEIVAQLTRRAR